MTTMRPIGQLQRDVVTFLRDYGARNVEIVPGGKHPKVQFWFRGKQLNSVLPGTESDVRAYANQISHLRRMLGPPDKPEKSQSRKLEEMMPMTTMQARGTASGSAANTPRRPRPSDINSLRLAPRLTPIVNNVPGVFLEIPKGDLAGDPEYQRPIKQYAVARIAKNWSWTACGVLLVSSRDSGKFYVFDGQHRHLAAMELDSIEKLPCLVFEKMAVHDEARALISANTERSAMHLSHQFKALIMAGDRVAKIAQELVHSVGRKVDVQSGPKTVSCVAEIMRAINADEKAIRRVWPIIAEIAEGRVLQARLIKGVFNLERRMKGESLSATRWHKKLVSVGYDRLLTSIRGVVAIEGHSGEKACAEGVMRAINRGMKVPLKISF